MINYIKASFQELQKVTWPKKEDSLKLTVITIIFSILTILFIMLVDKAFNAGYQTLLDLNPTTFDSTSVMDTPTLDIESITTNTEGITIIDDATEEVSQ